ncbi:MAG TPA: IS1182 family transposase [Chitinophagaceae bacterium]
MAKPIFKSYQQNQVYLFPPSLEDMIDINHPVRVVSEVMDRIDMDIIIKKYKGGGTTSYHPRMLLKVLIYAYLNNVYSSRRMEASVKENIYFMWLSGMQQPDHHTLNRFRSERLRNILKEVFAQVVLLLVDSGHVGLQEIYTDGTKIESVANRYTFVWGKAIKTNREKIKQQLKELWKYTQKVAAQEKGDDTPPDFDKIDSKTVKATIEKIDAALKDVEVSKEIKQKLNYGRKNWPAKLKQYAKQEKILKGRNNYSKTDTGATFMRMKEDHMLNGQLKPGYNVQLSTNNQFVVNYSLHPNPTDTKTLIPHLEQHKKLYGSMPGVQVADAGYGSEENYQYLNRHNIEAYVKPKDFDRKQKKNWQPNPFSSEQLEYDGHKDVYLCPAGTEMKNIGQYSKNENGFRKTYTLYKASGCRHCPLKEACHKQKGNRVIQINHNGRKLKQQAHERLKTEKGIYYRKQRPADVEPVFGNIKSNKNFKRFLLKGIDKTEIEWGLLCLAHNLKKVAA